MILESGILFIGDIIKTKLKLPLIITSNFCLRKASIAETKKIKNYLTNHFVKFSPDGDSVIVRNPYESNKMALTRNLDDDHRYWLFQYDLKDFNDGFDFEIALFLSRLNLSITFSSNLEFTFIKSHSLKSPIFYTDLLSSNEVKVKEIIENDIEEIGLIFELIKNFRKDEYPFIYKSLMDYSETAFISNHTSFKVISYLAVLEHLLCSEDNSKSITHQLKSKIELINNTSDKPVDFRCYFTGPDTLTLPIILEKVYQYRSSIAHGDPVDLNGRFKILNKEKVLPFLNEIIQMTLKEALIKPKFFDDLRKI